MKMNTDIKHTGHEHVDTVNNLEKSCNLCNYIYRCRTRHMSDTETHPIQEVFLLYRLKSYVFNCGRIVKMRTSPRREINNNKKKQWTNATIIRIRLF